MEILKLNLPNIEEIKEIKNGNIDIISKYYLDNLNYLKRYARAFCRKINNYNEFEDYVQEIFINFQNLEFDNEKFFGHSCYRVFINYRYGGARKRQQLRESKTYPEECILDKTVKNLENENTTYADLISVTPLDDYINIKPDISESLFTYLSLNLAKQQKRVFEQFYWTGKTYNEIAEELAKSPKTVKRTREEIFKKFRKEESKEELKEFLKLNNYEYCIN